MGIELEWSWPGVTREALSAAADDGRWFEPKMMFKALNRIAHSGGYYEKKIDRLRERYDLEDLCNIKLHPNDWDPDWFKDESPYVHPSRIALAAERLALAIKARDPDAEPIVRYHAGFDDSDVESELVESIRHTWRRIAKPVYRLLYLPYVEKRQLTDADWSIFREDLLCFAAQARWISDQGVEEVVLIMNL